MELRVLRYFMTIAREGSITSAANVLHVTQQRFPGRSAIWKMNWARSYSSVEVII